MIWGAVGSVGPKSLLVLIEEGVKVNTQVDLDLLKENLLARASASFPNGYIFTQDGLSSQ